MVKYFCDICGKDITNEIHFNIAFIYETRRRKYGCQKLAHRQELYLCEECNEIMTKKIKEINNFKKGLDRQ